MLLPSGVSRGLENRGVLPPFAQGAEFRNRAVGVDMSWNIAFEDSISERNEIARPGVSEDTPLGVIPVGGAATDVGDAPEKGSAVVECGVAPEAADIIGMYRFADATPDETGAPCEETQDWCGGCSDEDIALETLEVIPTPEGPGILPEAAFSSGIEMRKLVNRSCFFLRFEVCSSSNASSEGCS